jgi:DNA ligase-3
LRISAGPKIVLDALHPDAYKLYQIKSDIAAVVRDIQASSRSSLSSSSSSSSMNRDRDDEMESDDEQKKSSNSNGGGKKMVAKMKSKGKGKGLLISIDIGTPFRPQLAAPCKSYELAIKKCPGGIYAEIKYDGERIQV